MSENIQESFMKTRVAGAIAAGALDEVAKLIKPGVTTNQIDNLCYEYINDKGGYSAPLYYRGFPKSCCTSTNHVICHGIPGDKILINGFAIKATYNPPWTLPLFRRNEAMFNVKWES